MVDTTGAAWEKNFVINESTGEMTESNPSKVPKNWLRQVMMSNYKSVKATKVARTSNSRSLELTEAGRGVPKIARRSFSATSFAKLCPTAFSKKYLEAYELDHTSATIPL